MAEIVLRVRLIGGASMDITYDEPGTSDPATVADHAVSALGSDHGSLRAAHGDRLVVLFARGVAAVEIAPRGAIV